MNQHLPNKPIFLIEGSVLTHIISKSDYDDDSKKLFNRLLEFKKQNIPFKAVSHIGSLLRSIWIVEDIDVDKLKQVLDVIVFYPSPNFKDAEAIKKEFLKLTSLYSLPGTKGGGAS